MSDKSKTVRVSTELYDQATKFSQDVRPKTTIQYVIEDALTEYLENRGIAEDGPTYTPRSEAPRKTTTKKTAKKK